MFFYFSPHTFVFLSYHPCSGLCGVPYPRRDLPQDLCPVYRPGEWEQLPSEQELNPFSRYEALAPKQPIVFDDIESTLSETGEMLSNIFFFNYFPDDII